MLAGSSTVRGCIKKTACVILGRELIPRLRVVKPLESTRVASSLRRCIQGDGRSHKTPRVNNQGCLFESPWHLGEGKSAAERSGRAN